VLSEGGFYLAGGTAVYYYLEHRESVDLDFFSPSANQLTNYQSFFRADSVLSFSDTTIHAVVENVKTSLFYYPYSLLNSLQNLDSIQIASLEDMLGMKINAIVGRGSRKDFTDLYFIIHELNLTPAQCIELFQQKYGDYNPLILQKALTYFEDADKEPALKMLTSIDWQRIKTYFQQSFVQV